MPKYDHGWSPADESASIAEANARYGQQRAEAAIERLTRRVRELEERLGIEPEAEAPPYNQTLIESADGYPARSTASDPDDSVEWVGPHPPPMGFDKARPMDVWRKP
jgi:hypothetical protein